MAETFLDHFRIDSALQHHGTVPRTNAYRGTAREVPRHILHASVAGPLCGLLNLALDGLDRFRANGRRYSIGETMAAELAEFRNVTDPVAGWIDRATILTPNGVVTKKIVMKRIAGGRRTRASQLCPPARSVPGSRG